MLAKSGFGECNAAKLHFLLQSLLQFHLAPTRAPSPRRGFVAKVFKSAHCGWMPRLTPNAAAEQCGMSRATILRAIATKDLPAEKQGGQWSIEQKALDRWGTQRPQRARRRPVKGFAEGGRAETGEAASTVPLSVSAGNSEQEREVNERLEAFKAFCAALQAVCEGLRADVEALQQQVVHLSAKTLPEASKSASGSASLTKRRLWPF